MIQAKLFVLGTERELLSTDLECYRTRGATTGRPGPIPMGGLVALTFVSGAGDGRLLYAFLHSPEGELCTLITAKIVFYAGDSDGVVLFEYRLKDAAFVYWKEEFSATGEMPMTVTLVISAAILEIKGITWVKPWRESGVLPNKNVAREKEGQKVVLGDAKWAFSLKSFADDIFKFNKATDGGGVLLNGNPASAIHLAIYYETTAQQGASIFRSISHGHMFMNGNKRTAVAALQAFARQHELKTVSQQQMMNVVVKVSTGQVTDVSQIAKMLIR